jgi:citrate lyase subunit beta-like protein
MHLTPKAVPGSSKKFLEKSRGLNVDCVAYDLEDSVTLGRKAEARSNLRQFLSQPRSSTILEQAVRINAVESGLALDDLTEVVLLPSSCIMEI